MASIVYIQDKCVVRKHQKPLNLIGEIPQFVTVLLRQEETLHLRAII